VPKRHRQASGAQEQVSDAGQTAARRATAPPSSGVHAGNRGAAEGEAAATIGE